MLKQKRLESQEGRFPWKDVWRYVYEALPLVKDRTAVGLTEGPTGQQSLDGVPSGGVDCGLATLQDRRQQSFPLDLIMRAFRIRVQDAQTTQPIDKRSQRGASRTEGRLPVARPSSGSAPLPCASTLLCVPAMHFLSPALLTRDALAPSSPAMRLRPPGRHILNYMVGRRGADLEEAAEPEHECYEVPLLSLMRLPARRPQLPFPPAALNSPSRPPPSEHDCRARRRRPTSGCTAASPRMPSGGCSSGATWTCPRSPSACASRASISPSSHMISHDRLRSPSICFDLPRSQVRESGLETLRLSFRGCDAFTDEVAERLAEALPPSLEELQARALIAP